MHGFQGSGFGVWGLWVSVSVGRISFILRAVDVASSEVIKVLQVPQTRLPH